MIHDNDANSNTAIHCFYNMTLIHTAALTYLSFYSTTTHCTAEVTASFSSLIDTIRYLLCWQPSSPSTIFNPARAAGCQCDSNAAGTFFELLYYCQANELCVCVAVCLFSLLKFSFLGAQMGLQFEWSGTTCYK